MKSKVSATVICKNEAHNIEACVRSLLAQDYPFFEVIVLDDNSEDDTAKIVQGLGLSETGTISRMLRGTPLPQGWTGKGWACHQLAQEARGQFFFFTDADTEHEPGALSALVAYAQKHRADLVSAWPRLMTKSLGEKLVVPMVIFAAMTMYPHWLRHPDGPVGWRRHPCSRRTVGPTLRFRPCPESNRLWPARLALFRYRGSSSLALGQSPGEGEWLPQADDPPAAI